MALIHDDDPEPNVSRETPPRPFKVGDSVRVKGSGMSPFMTISGVLFGGMVNCIWFDKELKRYDGQFPEACLQLIDDFKNGLRAGVAKEFARRIDTGQWKE